MIAKTTLIALSLLAAGSASAFACGNQINASVSEQMPAASKTEANLERAPQTTTVASVERITTETVVVAE